MAGFPFIGAGSTLGPFGNAGPATASGSAPFDFDTGTVNFGAAPTVQTVAPWLVLGAVVVVGGWFLAQQ